MLEVNKKVGVFEKKDLGGYLEWKKVFDYNNLLNGSIQIEFHHSVFFQWSKGFHFSPKVNEADNGYNDQIW